MSQKLSQQELRQLMAERAAKKAEKAPAKRIESALAHYDDNDRLCCVVCNVIISSENLWLAHLGERSHKRKIEELRAQRNKAQAPVPEPVPKAVPKASVPVKKRQLPSDFEEKLNAPKPSKFANLAEFSKKESLIKKVVQGYDSDEEDEEEEGQGPQQGHEGSLPEDLQEAVPDDFFDAGVAPTVPVAKKVPKESKNPKTAPEASNSLPKGFFDNPSQNRQAQKDHESAMDAEMELFRKQIAEEVLLSEQMAENDIEDIQKEREIDEIEEQIANWQKVDDLQKRIEVVRARRKDREDQRNGNSVDDSDKKPEDKNEEVDDDDDDDEDLDDPDFWRCKGFK